MSWGEVKKVNSDLNVPLDERMGYVGGIIPRGKTLTTISNYSKTSEDITLLDITGSGCIHELYSKAYGQASGYTSDAISQITVICDEGTDSEKTISLCLDVNAGTSSGMHVSTDLSKLYSAFRVQEDASLELVNNYNTVKEYVINEPIVFNKTLTVKISRTVRNVVTYAGGSVGYTLD